MSDQDDGLSDIGHNTVAGEQLRGFVERIERLNEEKKAISEDTSEVYKEAKSTGFDTKIIRKVVRLRAMEKSKRDAETAATEVYLHALGML